jgi:hypothetical protein
MPLIPGSPRAIDPSFLRLTLAASRSVRRSALAHPRHNHPVLACAQRLSRLTAIRRTTPTTRRSVQDEKSIRTECRSRATASGLAPSGSPVSQYGVQKPDHGNRAPTVPDKPSGVRQAHCRERCCGVGLSYHLSGSPVSRRWCQPAHRAANRAFALSQLEIECKNPYRSPWPRVPCE